MKTVVVDVSSLRPSVTALVKAFCILRGVFTKIRMYVQLEDASIGL